MRPEGAVGPPPPAVWPLGGFAGQVHLDVPSVRPQDLSYPSLQDHVPDPPPTPFEQRLREGRPFGVVFPAGHHYQVDPARIVPVRDLRTRQLRGYVLREVATQWSLDRDGRITGNASGERPLSQPVVDPIDLVMIFADVGVIVVKGGGAAATVLFGGAARTATGELVVGGAGPIIARFGRAEAEEMATFWRGLLANPATREQAQTALRVLAERGRPSWRQSEMEIEFIYQTIGGRPQVTELYLTRDLTIAATRPDVVASGQRVEVKNWFMKIHPDGFGAAEMRLQELAGQIEARDSILAGPLPRGELGPGVVPELALRREQTVILDLRGQALTNPELQTIGQNFADATGLRVDRIQVLVWEPLERSATRIPGQPPRL